MNEKYIVQHSRPVEKIKELGGIYFLINHRVVVYVGSSRKLISRVEWHMRNRENGGFKFNRFFLLPLEGKRSEWRQVEDFYIKRFKPKHNINGACQTMPW